MINVCTRVVDVILNESEYIFIHSVEFNSLSLGQSFNYINGHYCTSMHCEHGTGYWRSWNCCDRRTCFVVIRKHFCFILSTASRIRI